MSDKDRMLRFGAFLVLVLSFFLIVQTLKAFKEYSHIGTDPQSKNTIVVRGEGEVLAIPDTAVFSFTVMEEGKTVAEAQQKATTKIDAALGVIKNQGIEDKDIKTVGYYVNPKYDYSEKAVGICPADGPCPPRPTGNPVLVGYEVNHTVEIKVRQSEKAGDLLSRVGSVGASQVSGIEFKIDDHKKVESEAREKAIVDAQEKAQRMAQALGVRIVKIVGFNETPGYYGPMAYGRTSAMDSSAGGMKAEAAPVSLPAGENKVTTSVEVIYEIR